MAPTERSPRRAAFLLIVGVVVAFPVVLALVHATIRPQLSPKPAPTPASPAVMQLDPVCIVDQATARRFGVATTTPIPVSSITYEQTDSGIRLSKNPVTLTLAIPHGASTGFEVTKLAACTGARTQCVDGSQVTVVTGGAARTARYFIVRDRTGVRVVAQSALKPC